MDRLASEGPFTVSLRAGSESGDCKSCPTFVTPLPTY
jgi:hypothetical protein